MDRWSRERSLAHADLHGHRCSRELVLLLAAEAIGSGADPDVPAELVVRWDGDLPWKSDATSPERLLQRPRIVKIHIRNTGKKPIEDSDFKEPIKVIASEDGSRQLPGLIVDLRVTRTSHPGIHPPTYVSVGTEDTRSFTPALLNPGDWLEVQVIADKTGDPPLTVTSWIKGQSRPMRLRPELAGTPLREAVATALHDALRTLWELLPVGISAMSALIVLLVWLA